MLNGLVAYLDSVKARDPAPRTRWEILLYPGLWALGFHRVAHWLFRGELFFLARLIRCRSARLNRCTATRWEQPEQLRLLLPYWL